MDITETQNEKKKNNALYIFLKGQDLTPTFLYSKHDRGTTESKSLFFNQ